MSVYNDLYINGNSEQGPQGSTSAGGRVELLLHCTDLANLDTFTKTDPMCVVFIKQFGQWREYGRTEAVQESLNPKFTSTFIMGYDPDCTQQLLFSVYDTDSRSNELKMHDLVGTVETDLAALIDPDTKVTSTCKSLRVPGDPKARGCLHIVTEFVRDTRSKAHLHLGAVHIDKKGMFSLKKVNSFLEISRSTNSINFHPVHRTETSHRTRDPRWRPFELSVQKLVNGDHERKIQFSCWHQENDGNHQLVGHAITTLKELQSHRGKSSMTLPLINPKKSKSKGYKDSGLIKVLSFRLDMAHTLLDYVRGGCAIRLTCAVDFTASNGQAEEATSLHHLQQNKENQYIDAIKRVGSLLGHYDLEQKIPAYGFGAKLSKHEKEKVSHCFPLNGNQDQPWVKGIQGLISAYKESVPKLKFAGPSVFSPVIERVFESVRSEAVTQENQHYTVLLIITDGVLNDLDQTIDLIIETSSSPLSIVIVGVGPADFSIMEQFQSQGNKLLKSSSCSAKAKRDNVHFAALRKQKFVNEVHAKVARDTFARVSQQVVGYMKEHHIHPNRPCFNRVAPEKGWIDKEMNLQQESHTETPLLHPLTHAKSSLSIYSNANGPMCPTCGSMIETDTAFTATDTYL